MPSSVLFKIGCMLLPDFFHPGSEHIASSLKELATCTVSVSSLCIYETPLQQGPMQALVTISHHFLVVEVSTIVHPTYGDSRKGFKIQAEKTGRDENGKNTGIHVREIHFVCEGNSTQTYSTDTRNLRIPMGQLLEILTNHCPDYDILNDNCWSYADKTFRALVQKLRLGSPRSNMPRSALFKISHIMSSAYFHPGLEHVASSLADLAKDMCTVRVSSLSIYQTPLKQVRGFLSHHLLVVEVSTIAHPTQGAKKGLTIHAEKTRRDENGKNAGIHVKESHLEKGTEKYSIDTHNVSIPMDRLLEILTNHCADYDILNDNCWLYADNTLRALVQEFRDLQPEIGDAINDSLQQITRPIMPGRVVASALATLATVGLARR